MKDERKQVNFRLSDEEATKVALKAQAANLSISGYCRIMAVEGKVKPQIMDKETGKALLPHLSHIGSNINQLAKVANAEGITLAMAAQLETVQNQFNALWELLLDAKKPKREAVIVQTVTAAETGMKEENEEQKPEISSSSPSDVPMCEHCGVPMEKRTVKSGNNVGRHYWACPNAQRDDGIHKFYGWAD